MNTVSKHKKIGDLIVHAVLIVLGVIVLIPIYLIILTSFKSGAQASVLDLSMPSPWLFQNYVETFSKAEIPNSIKNSVIISVSTLACTLLLAAPAAYIVSRRKNKFTQASFFFLISGLVAPLAIIPEILIIKSLHLMGSYAAVVLVQVASKIPFTFFMLTGFVGSIPRELDESSVLDGCSPVGIFTRIILPLLRPVIMTAIVLIFIGIWNDYMISLYFIPRSNMYTMPLMVRKFIGFHTADMQLICTHMVFTMIPIVALYIFAQKYIVSGLTSGSVKG